MDLIKYCLTKITLDINSDAIANYNMWSNSFLSSDNRKMLGFQSLSNACDIFTVTIFKLH